MEQAVMQKLCLKWFAHDTTLKHPVTLQTGEDGLR